MLNCITTRELYEIRLEKSVKTYTITFGPMLLRLLIYNLEKSILEESLWLHAHLNREQMFLTRSTHLYNSIINLSYIFYNINFYVQFFEKSAL